MDEFTNQISIQNQDRHKLELFIQSNSTNVSFYKKYAGQRNGLSGKNSNELDEESKNIFQAIEEAFLMELFEL